MAWTITYSKGNATMRALELTVARRKLVSEAADSVELVRVHAKTSDDFIFAYGEDITIFKNGTQWFRGKVRVRNRFASGRTRQQSYTVLGPWDELERLVFQQQWSGIYTAHVILNLSPANIGTTLKQTIEAVLDYAIAQGVALQKGNILPSAEETIIPPANEIDNATCAAVIKNQLRWLLRAGVAWFDYSSNPPTLHIRTGSKLTETTLDIQKVITEIDATSREDLVRPAVVIKYERTSTIDGAPRLEIVTDAHPVTATGREIDALLLTFPLQGINTSTISAEITTEEIDAASLDWWKQHKPHLDDAKVKDLAITNVRRRGTKTLPKELVEGALETWMKLDNGSPVDWEQEVIEADAVYHIDDQEDRDTHTLTIAITATNAESGTYSILASVQQGDPIPVGLAQFLYNLVNVVQYEGSVAIAEQDLSAPGRAPMGTRINIRGGRAEWVTMRAPLVEIHEDIRSGRSVLFFRPLPTMAASDLMEFLRVRHRRRWTNPATQNSGVGIGADVQLGRATANRDGQDGPAPYKMLTVKHTPQAPEVKKSIAMDAVSGKWKIDFGDGKTVIFDKENMVWGEGINKAFAPRWVRVCVKNADGSQETKRCKVLATEVEALGS